MLNRKKSLPKIVLCPLAILSLALLLPYQAVVADPPLATDALKLKAFVEAGIAYIKKVGPKQAYAEFSKLGNRFNQGELYLFVYDYSGKCLAHGSTPSRVGKNFTNERDKYGTPVVKMTTELAKTGGGFISYYWPEPKTKTVQFKTAYIKAVDNHTLIGAGLYKMIDVPKSQLIKLEELKAFVNSAIDYFDQNGAAAAYKEFDNPQGKFKTGELYLFIIDYNGIVLAHGADKGLIGTNLYATKDEFGTPFVQLFIQAAKAGAGMVSYYWPEPLSKKIKLKMSYIKPLTQNAFIGAGIYEN